eukprot:15449150-Alexandrium_andersonii.AAC.1
MLQAIEGGMQWPGQLRQARCAYLAKTEQPSEEALDFRGLLILPAIYRLWARLRLRQLTPWIESWAPPPNFLLASGGGGPRMPGYPRLL